MTFFGFPKVKWPQYTGEVGVQMYQLLMSIFLRINTPKIIKIGYFLRELFEKYKVGRFLGHSV